MKGSRPIYVLLYILVAFLLFNSVSAFKTGFSWKLIVEDPRNGQLYYGVPVQPKDEFTLSYRHSVSGSMVYGSFEITSDGQINPLTTAFTTFGPGLPWLDASVKYTIENGLITVYHDEPPREHIRLWVSPQTGETITMEDGFYQLAAFSDYPLLVMIHVKQ